MTNLDDVPSEMTLLQRSYWLRKEDVIKLDEIKNGILAHDERGNLDLSAVLRGLIVYAKRQQQYKGDHWNLIIEEVNGAVNPKKRGPVSTKKT